MGYIKEETVVEWLVEQLGNDLYIKDSSMSKQAINQAKQMEKEHRDKCELLESELLEQRNDLLEALKEMQIDLNILQSNFRQIEKVDSRAEGMFDIVQKWIDRNNKVIEKATSQNQHTKNI